MLYRLKILYQKLSTCLFMHSDNIIANPISQIIKVENTNNHLENCVRVLNSKLKLRHRYRAAKDSLY